MAGFCPGPAIASLSMGIPQTFLFTFAMFIGMFAHDRLMTVKSARPSLSQA